MLDFLNPNTWSFEPPELRMYAGRTAEIECAVDEEDYKFFTRWLWVPKISPCGKIYFRRAISTYDSDGARHSSATVYLHVEILTRAQGGPPTLRHNIADHLDGDSLNNRQGNLRWATKRENNQNRFGRHQRQRVLHV